MMSLPIKTQKIYKHLSMSDTCRLFYQLRCLSYADDNRLAGKMVAHIFRI